MARRTDPSGRVFVSYRRARGDEVGRMVGALRLLGVPTWQDVRDLGPHSAEADIREVLADTATSGAVVWISPEVEDSAFIRDIEVPAIVERVDRGDGFFAVEEDDLRHQAPDRVQPHNLQLVRRWLINVPARVVHRARQVFVRLAAGMLWRQVFKRTYVRLTC